MRHACLSRVLEVSHFLGSPNLGSSNLEASASDCGTFGLGLESDSDSDTNSINLIDYAVNRIALQTGPSLSSRGEFITFPFRLASRISISFFSFTFPFTSPLVHSEPASCPTCTTSFCCIPWNLVHPLVPSPLAPTCIDWHSLHCLSSHSYVYAHAPFIHFGGCRSRTRRSIFCRSACISPWSLLRVIRKFTIDTTCTQPFRSVFGHIAVFLMGFPLPLYLSCRIHTPPVSRRNIHIPSPAIRT